MTIASVDEFVDALISTNTTGHVCSETPVVIVFDDREWVIERIETTGIHKPLRLITGHKYNA